MAERESVDYSSAEWARVLTKKEGLYLLLREQVINKFWNRAIQRNGRSFKETDAEFHLDLSDRLDSPEIELDEVIAQYKSYLGIEGGGAVA